MIILLFGIMTDDEIDFINKLFLKMNIKMYNISFNILKNKFDTEEAVSQTFLKIIENIEKISALPCPQIEPYCVVILKNETMNIIRKRKKMVHVEEIDYLVGNEKDDSVEKEYIKRVNKEKLLSCVNKLSGDEKNFIYLRFLNEMKFKDIAVLLGITEEAAKKRSQLILKKLRLYYEKGDIYDRNL